MADRMQEAMQRLSDRLQAANSRSITYVRGAYSVVLLARLGGENRQSTDQNGIQIYHSDRDYLIQAALLILNSVETVPQHGDRITDSIDGKVFEVRAMKNEPCYRLCDGREIDLRVHTFEVS